MAPQTPGSANNPGATSSGGEIQVTEGKCVTIKISMIGQAVMGVTAVALMGMGTFGDIDDAKGWAILVAIIAAAWTVVSVLTQQHHRMVNAFELGRSIGEQSMRPVR